MFKLASLFSFKKNKLSETIARSQKGIQDTMAKLESGADNFSDEKIVTKQLTRLISG